MEDMKNMENVGDREEVVKDEKKKEKFNLIMGNSQIYAFCVIPKEKDKHLNDGNKVYSYNGWRDISDYTEKQFTKQQMLKIGEFPELFKVEGVDGDKFSCNVSYVELFFKDIKGLLGKKAEIKAYLPKKCEPFVFRVELCGYEGVLYFLIAPRTE